MSDKQIKVRAIDEFKEYDQVGNILCEVSKGEEFVADLYEESGEYFASDSKGREVFVGELNFNGVLELDECFELNNKGLYKKYTIINNETGQEVEGEYFVLKPENDPAARAAMIHYATRTENKELEKDIVMWVSKFM